MDPGRTLDAIRAGCQAQGRWPAFSSASPAAGLHGVHGSRCSVPSGLRPNASIQTLHLQRRGQWRPGANAVALGWSSSRILRLHAAAADALHTGTTKRGSNRRRPGPWARPWMMHRLLRNAPQRAHLATLRAKPGLRTQSGEESRSLFPADNVDFGEHAGLAAEGTRQEATRNGHRGFHVGVLKRSHRYPARERKASIRPRCQSATNRHGLSDSSICPES